MGSFAILMFINAMIGMNLLKNIFGKTTRNSVVVENLIESTEEQSNVETQYNNRMPRILESNELTTKMFSHGWKFDLFNGCDNVQKQLFGASIIFSMLYFSMAEVIMTQDTFSITVFVYSLICLFSYFNITYVRDFDALQINFVPIMLATIAMIQAMHSSTVGFSLIGMTTTLLVDSYFAMKY
jgi:hypothetical protein